MRNQADPPEVMTASTWLERVHANKDALKTLIRNYHPASHAPAKSMPITAPNAEIACANVRQSIAAEDADKPAPVDRFDTALAQGNIGELMSLLNGAWFGVPESTDCWQLEGFKAAVDLLDDPPQDPQEPYEN